MGNNFLPYLCLYFMVFKFLQGFPLGIKSLIFQAVYGLVLLALISIFGLSKTAFLAGFLFSNIYIFLFFYSTSFLLKKDKRRLGMILFFVKWFLLICVLVLVSWFIEGKAFLIGLSGILSFLLLYIFENLRKRKQEEKS